MYGLKYILKYNIQIKVCYNFKCVTNFLNFMCLISLPYRISIMHGHGLFKLQYYFYQMKQLGAEWERPSFASQLKL